MPRLKVYDLATGTWQYAGGVDPVALATDPAFVSRYAPIALGRVAAPVVIAVDQTGISALADLTGFTITVNVVAGRFYEAQWLFESSQLTATASQSFQIVLDGVGVQIGTLVLATGQINVWSGAMQFSGGPVSGNVPVVTPGSRVIKLRGSTSAGTMNIANGGVMNGRFSVKDIGPNP